MISLLVTLGVGFATLGIIFAVIVGLLRLIFWTVDHISVKSVGWGVLIAMVIADSYFVGHLLRFGSK